MKKYRQSLIISFTQSMAALLKSGLQLQEALTVYSNIESSREGKKLCFVLRERINNGLSFSKALETYRNSFGNLYLELVSIGENSGTIVDVFEKLSGYLKEKKETTQKLVQALIYPLIVSPDARIRSFVPFGSTTDTLSYVSLILSFWDLIRFC